VSGFRLAGALWLLVIAIGRFLLGRWRGRLRLGHGRRVLRRIAIEVGNRARYFGRRCRSQLISD
jgi:hypothetical protein